jgi:hypothetical protein
MRICLDMSSVLSATLLLGGILLSPPSQSQIESQKMSVVPRFNAIAPVGEVLDWDKYFVFEEVPGAKSYFFDVVSPGAGSCATSNNGLTIGSSGGSFTRELSTVSPAKAPEVECAAGQCKTKLFFAMNYVEPSSGPGSRCQVALRTYYYSIRTTDGHYADKVEFKPRLSKYEL